jgi:osmotically-inducible protein OsmY
MANLPTVRRSTTDPRSAGPAEIRRISSGWPVSCADDPSPIGKVDDYHRDGVKGEALFVSTGWLNRTVRRVPVGSILSTEDRRVWLGITRREFSALGRYLPDPAVVANAWAGLRDFKPFRYPGTASITVACCDGAVTLSGHVAHDGHRREALRCVENTVGMVSLSDRLITDQQLASAVVRSFVGSPDLQPSLVRVSARLGQVILEGDLPREDLIALASSLAWKVAGVVAVDNRLRLQAPRAAAHRAPSTRRHAEMTLSGVGVGTGETA